MGHLKREIFRWNERCVLVGKRDGKKKRSLRHNSKSTHEFKAAKAVQIHFNEILLIRS